RRRHTRFSRDWSSDVCSSDLAYFQLLARSMHWRGIALTTFDGRRWYTEGHDPVALSEGSDGWIAVPPALSTDRRYAIPFEYTVRSEERRVGKEYSGGW